MLRAIYLHGFSSAPDSTNLFQSIHFFVSLTEDNKYIMTNLLLNRDMNLSVMNGKFSIWTKQMLRSLPRWYSQWIYILVLTKKQIWFDFSEIQGDVSLKPTSDLLTMDSRRYHKEWCCLKIGPIGFNVLGRGIISRPYVYLLTTIKGKWHFILHGFKKNK